MTTSTFLTALRAHADLPLSFRSGQSTLAPGYHLTEIKRVSSETMDCGGALHQLAENQFELWVPPLIGRLTARPPMPAGKFLAIVDRVEASLPLSGDAPARVYVQFSDQPPALHEIELIEADQDRLWVDVVPVRTRCKAVERKVSAATGGCCGGGSDPGSSGQPREACCA